MQKELPRKGSTRLQALTSSSGEAWPDHKTKGHPHGKPRGCPIPSGTVTYLVSVPCIRHPWPLSFLSLKKKDAATSNRQSPSGSKRAVASPRAWARMPMSGGKRSRAQALPATSSALPKRQAGVEKTLPGPLFLFPFLCKGQGSTQSFSTRAVTRNRNEPLQAFFPFLRRGAFPTTNRSFAATCLSMQGKGARPHT